MCFALEPKLFPEVDEGGVAPVMWPVDELTDALCFMLRAHKKWKLPTVLFEVDEYVDKLETAFATHYKAIGNHCKDMTQENFRKGYFHEDVDKKYTCILEVVAAGSQPHHVDFTD